MNKKGMEITASLLVILIIAMVLFSIALLVVFKLAAQKEELTGLISDDTKKSIEAMLTTRGDRVAIPYQTIEVKKGKAAILTVGVLNILDKKPFEVWVKSKMFDKNNGQYMPKGGSNFKSCGSQCIVFTRATPIQLSGINYKVALKKQTIATKGTHVFSFPISTKSALKGTYYLEVDVVYDTSNSYDVTHTVKIVVN